MTVEGQRIGTGARGIGGNISAKVQELLQRIMPKERTGGLTSHRELASKYLGIVLANEVQAGRMEEKAARQKIQQLEESGLLMGEMLSTFGYFRCQEIRIPWLDLEFQLKVLAEHMPELFEQK